MHLCAVFNIELKKCTVKQILKLHKYYISFKCLFISQHAPSCVLLLTSELQKCSIILLFRVNNQVTACFASRLRLDCGFLTELLYKCASNRNLKSRKLIETKICATAGTALVRHMQIWQYVEK